MEIEVLPGVREASETFWQHLATLSPPVVLPDTYNHTHVSTSLLLALARLREVIAPGTMETERKARADQAFDLYDHGDMSILYKGAWEVQSCQWMRIVLVGDDFRPSNPKPLVFVVRFQADSDEVKDAYYDVRP